MQPHILISLALGLVRVQTANGAALCRLSSSSTHTTSDASTSSTEISGLPASRTETSLSTDVTTAVTSTIEASVDTESSTTETLPTETSTSVTTSESVALDTSATSTSEILNVETTTAEVVTTTSFPTELATTEPITTSTIETSAVDTSSSAAPSPTLLETFSISSEDGRNVVAPANQNERLSLQSESDGSTFTIEDGTNRLRVVGGRYVCVSFGAFSTYAAVSLCPDVVPTSQNTATVYVTCVQTLDRKISCSAPGGNCQSGCQRFGPAFTTFYTTTPAGTTLYLSQGLTQNLHEFVVAPPVEGL